MGSRASKCRGEDGAIVGALSAACQTRDAVRYNARPSQLPAAERAAFLMVKATADDTQHVGRVGFVSLGCPKALVDSERILTQLNIEGYETSNSYADAD